MNRFRRIFHWALAPCAFSALCLQAQASPNGSIGGVVRSPSGRPVADASVTAARVGGGIVAAVKSDPAGAYELTALAVGEYSLRIEREGYRASTLSAAVLPDQPVYRQDAVLVPLDAQPPLAPAALVPSDLKLEAPRAGLAERRPGPSPASGHGARRGGYFTSTGKAGTNEFHGAVYHSFGHDDLNARGFFGQKSDLRSNRFGAYVTGPVARGKTHFTYHYDRLELRAGAQPGYAASTPVDAFKRGDFQSLLTRTPIAVDALGRPIHAGQVFDPASTRAGPGGPVRDAFPNNAIPDAHPMRSRVAAGVVPLMARPERQGREFNVQGHDSGDQTWVLSAPSHHVRLDHFFYAALRANLTFSRTSHPAIRNCGGVDGCRFAHDPVETPELNRDYYGTGIYEDITTHHVRQRIDWIATPNLLNQTTVAYDEFHVTGHSISAGGRWPERLWGPGGNGLLEADAGPPAISFTGNTAYSPLGNEWGRSGFRANHEYSVANDLTWVGRRHTVRVGGEYRLHKYPFRGWANNVAGSFNFHRIHTGGFDFDGNNLAATGDPFASFLLGQVNSTVFEIPDLPTMIENFVALHVSDRYRATENLTLTLGLHFDYQTAIRERDDNMSTFDPRVPNPGADGRLGAMIFAGRGPRRTGTRTLDHPPRDAFGPRIGFAYRMGGRTVMRGGYGIYYSRVPHARFARVNTLGFRSHANAVDLSNGRRAAYFLDDGVPEESIVLPPSLDPAIGNHTTAVAVTRDRAKLPRIQDWSWSIQRRVAGGASMDLVYSGNRGSRLITDPRVLGPAANANAPAVLRLGSGVLGSQADSPQAIAAGASMPYKAFRSSVAQSLRPFPHMLDIGYLNVPVGNSFFHSLRTTVEKRFSGGALFRASYAWTKLTGMGAGTVRPKDGLGHGPQNPTDTQALERGLSAEDVPHRVLAAFTHDVPFFRRSKDGLASKVLGGWAVSGVVRVATGTPVNVVMANDLGPVLFNGQKRPDIVTNRVRVDHGGSFDATADRFFDPSAFADPGPLRFGNASRTMDFARGFHSVAEDFSLFKDAWLTHKVKLRLETQLGNVFNRVVFCDPYRNWSSASFGRTLAQCNSPRSVQFGLRLDF